MECMVRISSKIKVLIMALMLLSVVGLGQVETVDSYSETNWSNNDLALYSGSNLYCGQSFSSEKRFKLTSCVFYLGKDAGTTGNITASIYQHTGTYGTNSVPTGAALETSTNTIDASTLPSGSRSLFTFTFSGSITLAANTYYCIVVRRDNTGSVSQRVIVGRAGSSPAHGGNAFQSADGSSWTENAARDCCFYVYGIKEKNAFLWTNF